MATNGLTDVIVGIVGTAGLGGVAALMRVAAGSITDRLDALDQSFTRAAANLSADIQGLQRQFGGLDRRITRIESWKDLVSLPDELGRHRRSSDL